MGVAVAVGVVTRKTTKAEMITVKALNTFMCLPDCDGSEVRGVQLHEQDNARKTSRARKFFGEQWFSLEFKL